MERASNSNHVVNNCEIETLHWCDVSDPPNPGFGHNDTVIVLYSNNFVTPAVYFNGSFWAQASDVGQSHKTYGTVDITQYVSAWSHMPTVYSIGKDLRDKLDHIRDHLDNLTPTQFQHNLSICQGESMSQVRDKTPQRVDIVTLRFYKTTEKLPKSALSKQDSETPVPVLVCCTDDLYYPAVYYRCKFYKLTGKPNLDSMTHSLEHITDNEVVMWTYTPDNR